MRLDYILYAVAAVFFIITAASLALVAEATQRSLWVVTTIVLGLFSLGLGYYQRPKTKTSPSEMPVTPQPATMPQPQRSATDDAREMEAFQAENVSRKVETQIVPLSVSPSPMQVPSPIPVLAPTTEPSAVGVSSKELVRVKGIGGKRAAQLESLGINNIDDLANANAAEVASKLGVSVKIVEKWVSGAKKLA